MNVATAVVDMCLIFPFGFFREQQARALAGDGLKT